MVKIRTNFSQTIVFIRRTVLRIKKGERSLLRALPLSGPQFCFGPFPAHYSLR